MLEFVRLSQNGYANLYYSATVRSMLRSWHNFFFLAADPHGLISADKPPLGLWLQAASAKLFGFTPLSLLIPEAMCAPLAVALLYRIVAPRVGTVAALASACALAVFPSFVAVTRDNGMDPLLILLMLATCAAALTAIASDRMRNIMGCALLAGLAFNTKALASLVCVPGIAGTYLLCSPGSVRQRVARLGVAGVAFAVVAISWMAIVQSVPPSQRPFIGDTSSNSEVELVLGYNGLGRVGGQQGGPGRYTRDYLSFAQTRPLVVTEARAQKRKVARHVMASSLPIQGVRTSEHGRQRPRTPVPFAGSPGPLRIFGRALGGQGGWLVPLALAGMLGLGFVARGRAEQHMAVFLVLGGWFVIELGLLDFSAGIVHPYYVSALAPGLAAMVGSGSVALASLGRSHQPATRLVGRLLAVAAIAATVAVQIIVIDRESDPLWWRLPLIVLCLAALIAAWLVPRQIGWAIAGAVGALLVAPAVYSTSVWLAPVNGTFPVAGPYSNPGAGGYGLSRAGLRTSRSLIRYLRTHGATKPYVLLTESSDQADPLILLGLAAAAAGGYNTTDPALSAEQLATLVRRHQARYVMIGGPYARRGGNGALTAARLVCPEIPAAAWHAGSDYNDHSFLLDCAGKATQLRHPYLTARAFIRTHHVRYPLKLERQQPAGASAAPALVAATNTQLRMRTRA